MSEDNDKIFENLPELPGWLCSVAKRKFDNYLVMENISRGKKRLTCTACGMDFYEGYNSIHRTMTDYDYELQGARHNDYKHCPYCHAVGRVVNIKIQKLSNLSSFKCFAVVLPVSHDDVWIRCVAVKRIFGANNLLFTAERTGNIYFDGEKDYMRYHMTPGKAEMYEPGYYDSGKWYRNDTVREAFTWNAGLYRESYSYETVYVDAGGNPADGPDGTFLKYHSFELYKKATCCDVMPFVKYLSWYARHPQIEMLVKLGNIDTVNDMIYNNCDNRSLIDWTARTPQSLYRLTRQEYNEWQGRYKCDLELLKTYRRLKSGGAQGFQVAYRFENFVYRVSYFNTERKEQIHFIASCKRLKTEPIKVIGYIEKFARETPGYNDKPSYILRQSYELWSDYIDLAEQCRNDAIQTAEKKALKKLPKNADTKQKKRACREAANTVNPVDALPRNLTAAHNKLASRRAELKAAANAAERAKQIKKAEERMQATAKDLTVEFPTAEAVLAQIKELYSYSDGKYSVVVPSTIFDIVKEGEFLGHCVGAVKRYYERIQTNESYILFLRKSDEPETPYYTLEVEPDGTVRQKRTFNDRQNPDITEAVEFLEGWQATVAERLTERERKLAKRSKERRKADYAELRKNHAKIGRGMFAGQLLADVLEADLKENVYIKNKTEKERVTA